MPKPNYQYEKRARELAKKQKKEDKLKRRQEAKAKEDEGQENPEGATDSVEDSTPPEA